MDVPWFHHTPSGTANPWLSSCSIPFPPQDLLDGHRVTGTGQGTVKKTALQPSSALTFPRLQPWRVALLLAVPWLLRCHTQHLQHCPHNFLTHQIPLPGSHSLPAPAPTSSCQPYHCRQPLYGPLLCPRLGMEQVCGTAGWAWSTRVAPTGRLHACMALMDRQKTHVWQ